MSFDKAFDLIIMEEGGYTDGKSGASQYDPGGETKYGISKKAHPAVNIAALTLDQAKQIYKRDYWDSVRGSELPWPLSLFVFDCAVNQGHGTAIKLLQRNIGVTQDGIIGPRTLTAAKQMRLEAVALFMADRAVRYAGTKNFNVFGRGWMGRLFRVVLRSK